MEFAGIHAAGARHVPLDSLNAAELAGSKRLIAVLCQSGGRASKACASLRAAGGNAVVVEGGTAAWVAAGLPVVRGRSAVSLERQVRIAAGSLVVLGVVLGAAVHPSCLALSAFVGGGLVFSGITDTCGMGLLLAKMPWNRRG